DCLARHDESINHHHHHHKDRSPSGKNRSSHSGSVDELRRRERKCKKRSRRSRSYLTGSSSSQSEPENSEQSSDHGGRKKAHRSKKRKKDKHKGKKKPRRDISQSGDERRKRQHQHHRQKDKEKGKGDKDRDGKQQNHKSHANGSSGKINKKPDESKKSRSDDTHRSERGADPRNVPGISKLSFSLLCDEEPSEEDAVDARNSDKNHVELSVRLPSKKLTPSRWFNDEPPPPPPRSAQALVSSSSKSLKGKVLNGNDAPKGVQGTKVATPAVNVASPKYACETLPRRDSDSSDAEERLLNSHLPKALWLSTTAKKCPPAEAANQPEPDPSALASKRRSASPRQSISVSRQSSSSPDCAKIRKLLASKKVTSPDGPGSLSGTSNGIAHVGDDSRSPTEPSTPAGGPSDSRSYANAACASGVGSVGPTNSERRPMLSKWEKSDALPAAYRSRSNSRSKSGSARSASRSRSRDRSGGRSCSRSGSRSDSGRSRRSRSASDRRSTSKWSGSRERSRSRSYSRSSYSSRSRSRSRRYSSRSRSRSYSRSRSRSRSPSIPRRAGSPSFLDKRRITSFFYPEFACTIHTVFTVVQGSRWALMEKAPLQQWLVELPLLEGVEVPDPVMEFDLVTIG
ncbi:hypothetical protein BIW11_13295, partial [Tropilaelaps mercedesae]